MLPLTPLFSVTDATVYLLERTGDLAGALTLMLTSLNERVENMLTLYLFSML